MRGPDIQQDSLFSTVSPETRVPKDHPLRPIRRMVDEALKALDGDFADPLSGLPASASAAKGAEAAASASGSSDIT